MNLSAPSLLAMAVLTTSVWASEIWVNQNAAAGGTGSSNAPFQTITAGIAAASTGDTVTVRAGVYRESVTVKSGTSGQPFTLQALPGERAVIAGSDALTNWGILGFTTRNTNFARIFYKDVSWNVTALFEDGKPLGYSRTPNTGYWQTEAGSDPTNLVNANFNQADTNYWVGSMMFYASKSVGDAYQTRSLVLAYDPATHTITTSNAFKLYSKLPAVGVDCFYMYNKLELLDVAGEWACENLGGGIWRVYVWPSDGGSADNHIYEATRRAGYLLSANSRSHVVIDGLEVRHGGNIGIASSGTNITIRNCWLYDNSYKAVQFSSVTGATLRDCQLIGNGYGVTFGSCTDVIVEHNAIIRNGYDGMQVSGSTAANSSNVHIRSNYIRDHFRWGHPDGIQTYNGDGTTNIAVHDIWFENNAIINSGQCFMLAEVEDAHFINNIILGSSAATIQGSTPNSEYINNTIGFSSSTITTFSRGCTVKNNIFFAGHDNTMLGFTTTNQISDYNLFFMGAGLDGKSHLFSYNGTYYNTLAAYTNATGRDAHSLGVDPLFVNAPAYYDNCESSQMPLFTVSRVYMNHSTATFSVGDHAEYNFDGVVRTVTNIGPDYIEFSPSLPELPVTAGVICNWKTNTNYTYDFTLSGNSPARGAGEGGANMGSSVKLSDFWQTNTVADVDGDGIPDSWETQHFGGVTNANSFSLAANGVNTIYETYIAGLNPTNSASRFAVSKDRNIFGWNATSGRVYSVYWTSNLMNSFQPLETNIVWPQNSWTNLVSGAQADGFYRIKVRLGN
jgi:hypothetical protein